MRQRRCRFVCVGAVANPSCSSMAGRLQHFTQSSPSRPAAHLDALRPCPIRCNHHRNLPAMIPGAWDQCRARGTRSSRTRCCWTGRRGQVPAGRPTLPFDIPVTPFRETVSARPSPHPSTSPDWPPPSRHGRQHLYFRRIAACRHGDRPPRHHHQGGVAGGTGVAPSGSTAGHPPSPGARRGHSRVWVWCGGGWCWGGSCRRRCCHRLHHRRRLEGGRRHGRGGWRQRNRRRCLRRRRHRGGTLGARERPWYGIPAEFVPPHGGGDGGDCESRRGRQPFPSWGGGRCGGGEGSGVGVWRR